MGNMVKKLILITFIIFFASSALGSEVEEKIQKAEEAFNLGDTAKALEIYKEILAIFPDHLGALKRAALFLSWEGKFDESINYYEKAMELDPQDHQNSIKLAEVYSWNKNFDSSIKLYADLLDQDPGNTELQLKLAKVLSWAKRYRESITEYEKILWKKPEHREAKLGLAQVLSWKGDFERSIEQYRELVESYANDIEVLIGLARVLSWNGRLKESEEIYRKALRVQPGNLDAQIGLSWVLLWMGEKREALNLAERITDQYPQNKDANKLYKDVKKSVRPSFITGYDRIDDTDNNEIDIYRGTFLFHPEPQTDLGINYFRYELDLHRDLYSSSASVDSYFISLASRLNAHHSIYAKAGSDRIKDDLSDSRSFFVGAFSYKHSINERIYWSLGAARDTFKASAEILGNDIRVNTAYIDFFMKVRDPWSIYTKYEKGNLSDDNRRDSGYFSMRYKFPLRKLSLSLSYKLRYLSYDENLDKGYFDPQRFVSNIANVEVAGASPNHLFYYNLQVDAGIQNFHFDTIGGDKVESDNDRVLGYTGAFGFHIKERISMEFYYNHSDYALQIGTGFESTSAGVRLVFHF